MNIGEKVSWTHVSTTRVSQRGRTISARLREGVIQDIQGEQALVKLKSGKVTVVPISKLRGTGQKSEITEFVEAIKGSGEKI